MGRATDLEQRLTDAATDLAYILGTSTDRSTRSPFARGYTNLTTWAGKGAGRSGFTGTRSSGAHDLADRVADAVDAGRSLTADEHAAAQLELVKATLELEKVAAHLRNLVDAATTTKPTAAATLDLDYCRLCTAVGSSNVVLARGLCDWCWRLSQRLGLDHEGQPIDPHTDLVRLHKDGKKVSINTIARYHPIPTEGTVVNVTEPINPR